MHWLKKVLTRGGALPGLRIRDGELRAALGDGVGERRWSAAAKPKLLRVVYVTKGFEV